VWCHRKYNLLQVKARDTRSPSSAINQIGDGFQGANALAVELFKAEGFVFAEAIADALAAVAGQPGEAAFCCFSVFQKTGFAISQSLLC
jgi:hypothetical protein